MIASGQDPEEKRKAYESDIVYGTNNEFGFDYLRDNMAFSEDQKAQRDLSFAIVDEVDSILIDEARTPLIISGPADTAADVYAKIDVIIPKLVKQETEGENDEDGDGDYTIDEKTKQAHLTEAGHEKAEKIMVEIGLLSKDASLYDVGSISLLHHLYAGIRAHNLFHRDVDYVVPVSYTHLTLPTKA